MFRRILDLPTVKTGLPIGNLTSQLFANLYLNELDRLIVETLRPKHFIRYMDDFLLLDTDKLKLSEALRQIDNFVTCRLHLEINKRVTRLFPVRMGVEFVGYIHKAGYIRVRKSTWKREKRRLRETTRKFREGKIPEAKFVNIYASIMGHLQHADSYGTLTRLAYHKLLMVIHNHQRNENKKA